MTWDSGTVRWLVDKAFAPIKNWLLKSEQREHDKNIFLRSEPMLKEDDVMTRLDELQAFGTYRSRLLSTESFYRFFRLESNQYLDSELKQSSIEVSRILYDLLDFLAGYYVVGSEEDGYATKPKLAREEYDKFCKKVDRKIDTFRKAYRAYRGLVKKKLNI